MKQTKKQVIGFKKGRLFIGMLGLFFCALIMIRADFSHIAPEQSFVVERGRVLEIHLENIWPDAYIPTLQVGVQVVDIEVLSGPFSGEVVRVEHELSRFENLHLSENQKVLVSYFPHEEELTIYNTSVYGPSRGPTLFLAVGLLLVGMLLIGRSKGFYAIVSLIFTFVVIVYLLVHGIVTGGNPIFLSLATSLLIISFTTGMISGATKEAIAAILGAIVGLFAAGLTSVLLSRTSHISGIHLESVRHILYHTPPETFIQIPDLFFAVVIIATTGAMIDSTISLASTVSELKHQSPKITCIKLYKSSMQVGRSVLGANVNTLILAFVGTSLVTLLLIVLFGFSHLRIFNLELVAIEIIQGVAAGVSILIAIPATALFASYLETKDERGK